MQIFAFLLAGCVCDSPLTTPTGPAADLGAPIDFAATDLSPMREPHDLAPLPGGPRNPGLLLEGTYGTPWFVFAGDLDRDGDIDLLEITGDSNSASATSWLGDGTGHFTPRADTFALDWPVSFMVRGGALVDLDDDGFLDLLVPAGNVVRIYPGQPGGFGAPVDSGMSPVDGVSGVVVGDLDGDGVRDLVAAAFDGFGYVFRGQRGATPAFVGRYRLGDNPAALRLVDFDLDGHLDVVTMNVYGHDVSWLAGGGDLTFGPAVHFNLDATPAAMVVDDFDGDGAPDIAVVKTLLYPPTEPGLVKILYGDGSGGIVRTKDVQLNSTRGTQESWLTAGDFDGDRLPDLVIGARDAQPTTVLLSSGRPEVNLSGDAPSTQGIAADVNGDGWSDLLQVTLYPAPSTVRVYMNH